MEPIFLVNLTNKLPLLLLDILCDLGGYSLLLRSNGEMVAIAKTHRLDIKTTIWTECADMNNSRACHASTLR